MEWCMEEKRYQLCGTKWTQSILTNLSHWERCPDWPHEVTVFPLFAQVRVYRQTEVTQMGPLLYNIGRGARKTKGKVQNIKLTATWYYCIPDFTQQPVVRTQWMQWPSALWVVYKWIMILALMFMPRVFHYANTNIPHHSCITSCSPRLLTFPSC